MFCFLPLPLCNKLFQFPFTDSWPANRTYLMRTKANQLSTTKKNVFLLPFLFLHISIAFPQPLPPPHFSCFSYSPPPTHCRRYIEPTSTPHLPFIYLSLQRGYICLGSLIQEKALGAIRPLNQAMCQTSFILLGLECRQYLLMRNDRDVMVNFGPGQYI